MREILFRGKCSHKNQWVEGDLGHRKSRFCDAHTTGICDAYGTYVGVDQETIGQFTGFTDKNGKRIFEGDILYIEDDDGNKYVTKVWYERGGLVIDVKGCDYDYTVIGWLEYYYSMEIIGNIHDNPELIAND